MIGILSILIIPWDIALKWTRYDYTIDELTLV